MTTISLEREAHEGDGAVFFLTVSAGGASERFLLDTGSATTDVPHDWCEPRAAARTGSPGRSVLGDGSPSRGDRTATFTVADRTLREQPVVVREPPQPAILGVDVLGQWRCSYDLAASTLVIGDGVAHVGPEQPLTVGPRGHHYVELSWPGVSTFGVWDTAASITVVDKQWCTDRPELFRPAGEAVGQDAGGHRRSTPLATMTGPTIAGHSFPDSLVAVVDLSFLPAEPASDVIVGYPVICAARWIFDGPRRTWSVHPHAPA
ncbi:hypothetical protein [Barrientosiimonas endolithica]|uniref:Peptidase A2 domain-containing protein n=1 Tax=Barrientosiimonas endolithica TaxID=1535208 RepID=A0ABM8H9Y1_9MICO|nr:hypothetical protein [Barrientosiimonas endolithica]BDZ57741.1 hypothetical protein GCM10025872_13980 [Barrientosiimonas endolithica]